MSISHEKLFEAWPSLREYVATNKKQLMDQLLLESRARKWEEMSKPWFSGLASGRERKDFQRAGIPTPLTKEYLKASRRGQWIRRIGIVSPLIVMLAMGTWVVQSGVITKNDILRFQSMFMSIHVEPNMETVEAGLFQQGDIHSDRSRERPLRDVTINRFRMGKTEVTFEKYDRFAIATDRKLSGDEGWGRGRRPVINVSWQDARDYAAWLSAQTGMRYRLPTESEWEYVARSEGKKEPWAGTSSEEELGDFAWYSDNSERKTQAVGTKKANGLGLHDMSGNVWEWVEDCWYANHKGAPEDGSAWLEAGGGNCDQRVFRGGAWGSEPVDLRSSFWFGDFAGLRYGLIGFRLAQDIR